MVIRLLLVSAVVVVCLVLLRGRRGARHEAVRRLALLAFALVAALSVVFPQAWQRAAAAVGVGRGADLLLYGLIVAFLLFVATSYLRFRDLQHQITELARRLALDEAPAARPGAPAGVHSAAPVTAPTEVVRSAVTAAPDPVLPAQGPRRPAPR